jgi:MFS family permease
MSFRSRAGDNQAPLQENRVLEETPVRTTFYSLPKPKPVTWSSLPRKDQLAILFLCRLVDFLQLASLQTFMYFQLSSLPGTHTAASLSSQSGILQGCFTGAQVATAIFWGKVADHDSAGRKLVLLIGLIGTAISCMGLGFAGSFAQAVGWRLFGGGINGTVGIIRTMIAEITVEKKFQSRAFLILPMSFNVAGVLGPLMGGLLADPAKTLPGWFGPDAIFEMEWIRLYPYALPSVLNAVFLMIAAVAVFLGLEETLYERRGKCDHGLELANFLMRTKPRDSQSSGLPYEPVKAEVSNQTSKARQKLPFSRIWTRNVILTLLTTAFFDFHLG